MTTPTPTQVGQGYQTARDAWQSVTSPLSEGVNTLMDTLLYPFVWPLLELLELAIGDPDQLDAHAQAWVRAASELREQATAQRGDLERLATQGRGEAEQAYARRIEHLVQGLDAAATEMAKTADALADSATDLRNVEEMIRTVIRELVEWLIITWLAAQALAAITAGASEAAAAAASAAEAGVAVGLDLYLDAAADESEDRMRGDDGDGSRFRRWASGHTDPVVDAVR